MTPSKTLLTPGFVPQRPYYSACRANHPSSAATMPGIVYSSPTASTRTPSSRAVSAVTGPMHATAHAFTAPTSPPSASTSPRTVDELANVTASTPSAKTSRARSAHVLPRR